MQGDSITAGGVDEVEPVQQGSTNWANEEWVLEIRNELDQLLHDGPTALQERLSKKQSMIYKVPAHLKNLNDKAYEPQMVSFGPYHYGKEHFMPMEKLKHTMLLDFLQEPGEPLESYVNALAPVVQDLKDFYDALDPSWHGDNNTSRFLKLMVVDGCFMLYILGELGNLGRPSVPFLGDLETAGIKRDMLLLENQLPMLVLLKIDQVRNGGEPREESIQEIVLSSWGFGTQPPLMGKSLHVLDLYRKVLIWDEKYVSDTGSAGITSQFRSAIELTEAGIRLEPSYLITQGRIAFNSDDGVLTLPRLEVDHATESTFLNLIAFDGLHVGDLRGEVTSFIFFMRQLIKSPRDVHVLISSGILYNGIGSDEAIVQLFDSLSKDSPIHNPYTSKMYFDVYVRIRNYCCKRQNRLRAYVVHAYHESTNWSPLAYLSILAAILLFILSFLQTWYTLYPYYHPRK
ncbi:hypothetical protein RHMOL_Rhmol08G0061100 [Rhododendron molle]|uniref:Uncharacterized protein n=1 Tax=Rhododendron molle TaxID=49168 RepID=A0ACC0MK80_RHOML|nr:hypothetical protein RHMOL_Rhmol08G0061100 [Rhododendron molle]